jgi:hypothetical protein
MYDADAPNLFRCVGICSGHANAVSTVRTHVPFTNLTGPYYRRAVMVAVLYRWRLLRSKLGLWLALEWTPP